MNQTEILAKLVGLAVENLGINPEQLTPAARWEQELGADSMDLAELVMAVEEDFDITIDDAEAAHVEAPAPVK